MYGDCCGYDFLKEKPWGMCLKRKDLLAGLFDGGCQLAMFEQGLHRTGDGVVA